MGLLFTSEQLEQENWRRGLHLWQVKKSSKLIFCGVYYLAVLVYTKLFTSDSVSG